MKSQLIFNFKFDLKINLIDNWRNALDCNKSVVSVFLDLKKAFDTVDHEILL